MDSRFDGHLQSQNKVVGKGQHIFQFDNLLQIKINQQSSSKQKQISQHGKTDRPIQPSSSNQKQSAVENGTSKLTIFFKAKQ
jgi:hypothetical protein